MQQGIWCKGASACRIWRHDVSGAPLISVSGAFLSALLVFFSKCERAACLLDLRTLRRVGRGSRLVFLRLSRFAITSNLTLCHSSLLAPVETKWKRRRS